MLGSNLTLQNLNVIGGKVDVSEFDFSSYFVRNKTTAYVAPVIAHATGTTKVTNVHNSCDVTLGDDNFLPYINVAGIGGSGTSYLTDVSNSGDIYGGIHPYSSVYEDLIDTSVYINMSGVCNSTIAKAENVVNYGEIVGIGFYGNTAYDTNIASNTTMINILNTRIAGVLSSTTLNATLRDTNLGSVKVANFGDIYDVPYVISGGKPVAKSIPSNTNYINYGTQIMGVSGACISNGTNVPDFEIQPKSYNEGNITNLVTRNVYIHGVSGTGSSYHTTSLYNKGDITSYCGLYLINGVSLLGNVYNSQNDGDITVYCTNRTAIGDSSQNVYINGVGHYVKENCINNGNIYLNMKGMESTAVVSGTTQKKANINGLGQGAANFCINNGDITVVAGDSQTGYATVDITDPDFKKNTNGTATDTSYYNAATKKNYNLIVRGISPALVSNCSNYGDITIENVPLEELTLYPGADELETYQNYYSQGVINYADISGVTGTSGITDNLINQGNITVKNVAKTYAFGVQAATINANNVVNKGNILVENSYITEVAGIARYTKGLNHGLNTGNVTVKGKIFNSTYISGITCRQSTSIEMYINNTFNSGNIDISELELVTATPTGVVSLFATGIVGQIPNTAYDAVIENSANYGDIISVNANARDWRANTYLGGITGYWTETTAGTERALDRRIVNCINDGNITVNVNGQGFVGGHYVGGITRICIFFSK